MARILTGLLTLTDVVLGFDNIVRDFEQSDINIRLTLK